MSLDLLLSTGKLIAEQQDKIYFLNQELATAQQRIQELEQEVERLKFFHRKFQEPEEEAK